MLATIFPIVIFIELLLTLFIAWGIMHEERLIAFEDRIIAKVKTWIEQKKSEREFMQVETA